MKKTKNNLIKKIVSILVIFALTYNYFLIVGKTIAFSFEVFATSEIDLNKQNEDTINKNIKFDAYFGNQVQKNHYLIMDVNNQLQEMHMDITVKEGFLKDARIEISDSNYKVSEIVDENEIVENVDTDKIVLKQMNSKESPYTIIAKIEAILQNKMKIEEIKKNSIVMLKATYINQKGEEIPIEKEITINVGLTQNLQLEIEQELDSYFTYQREDRIETLIRTKLKLKPRRRTKKPTNKRNKGRSISIKYKQYNAKKYINNS